MIPGDLLSACPHRQFHKLPGLLDSRAALPNFYPNTCMPMQGGSLYDFYDGLWYDPAERQTRDLPCERRTRYRLSQPDTVLRMRKQSYDIQVQAALTLHEQLCSWSFSFRIKFWRIANFTINEYCERGILETY